MLCNLCMKDVDWTIEVKQHLRDHPMTYVITREICLICLGEKMGDELELHPAANLRQIPLYMEREKKAKKEKL